MIQNNACLVVKGFSQILGMDFTEVFPPAPKYSTLRMMISFSLKQNWKRSSLDVENAFVNAEIEEEIYMTQPEGSQTKGKSDHVYRSKKTLYVLRQASRVWHIH